MKIRQSSVFCFIMFANGWGCEECWDSDSVRIPRDEVSSERLVSPSHATQHYLHPLLCAGVNLSLSNGWFNLFFSFRYLFYFQIYTETILSLRGKAKMPIGKLGGKRRKLFCKPLDKALAGGGL